MTNAALIISTIIGLWSTIIAPYNSTVAVMVIIVFMLNTAIAIIESDK